MDAMRFHIGFLVYPHVTQLDLTGPAQFLSRMSGASIHLVWKNREPVLSDAGFSLVPTDDFATCPPLDMICIPGGAGQLVLRSDMQVLDWIAARAEHAAYVTSVCGGSLLLGAAGLLKGYRAASHWAYRDMLSAFGASPVNDRVVIDRNRITGGGVTAGIDFALTAIGEIRGEAEARAIQLVYEYAPAPPFGVGRPEFSTDDTIKAARSILS